MFAVFEKEDQISPVYADPSTAEQFLAMIEKVEAGRYYIMQLINEEWSSYDRERFNRDFR